MADDPETPFGSIEGALEYVSLLREALEEARSTVREDITLAQGDDAARRLEALQIVAYKLDRLGHHVGATRTLLNDLRTLRRLLLGERAGVPEERPGQVPVEMMAAGRGGNRSNPGDA